MRLAIVGFCSSHVPTASTVMVAPAACTALSICNASAGSPAPWNVSATPLADAGPCTISTAEPLPTATVGEGAEGELDGGALDCEPPGGVVDGGVVDGGALDGGALDDGALDAATDAASFSPSDCTVDALDWAAVGVADAACLGLGSQPSMASPTAAAAATAKAALSTVRR